MALFNLKYGNTKPRMVVTLKDPPEIEGGVPPVHDLTGVTNVFLNILLTSGVYLRRTMTIDPDPTTGQVSYQWLLSDWGAADANDGTKADPHLVGGLIVGPALPIVDREHQMEYEAVGPGSDSMTFPNTGPTVRQAYDTLRIVENLG